MDYEKVIAKEGYKKKRTFNIEIDEVWANRIAPIDDNPGGDFIGIEWSDPNIGFGSLQIGIKPDGTFDIDSEGMKNDFCYAVIIALANKLFPEEKNADELEADYAE